MWEYWGRKLTKVAERQTFVHMCVCIHTMVVSTLLEATEKGRKRAMVDPNVLNTINMSAFLVRVPFNQDTKPL